jgi:phosphatidylglycerophosphate synthase
VIPATLTRAGRFGFALSLALTLSRLVLAAPFVSIGVRRGSGLAAAVILVVGFLTDVFDGIVARHFGVATPQLRRLDSACDTVFYLTAGFCVWRLHPDAIASHSWLIAAAIGTLVAAHAFEVWKFGREASYHAWLAKAWGASLFSALVLLFVTGDDRLLTLALWLGVASHIENVLITARLRECRTDVKSIFHVARSATGR